jgi:hypothetical protein
LDDPATNGFVNLMKRNALAMSDARTFFKKRDCASGSRIDIQNAFIALGRRGVAAAAAVEIAVFSSMPSVLAGRVRFQQSVQVNNEIAHMRVVHRRLCLGFPSKLGRFVVGKDSDNIKSIEIAEFDAAELLQLAAENQVEELFVAFAPGHVRHSVSNLRPDDA